MGVWRLGLVVCCGFCAIQVLVILGGFGVGLVLDCFIALGLLSIAGFGDCSWVCLLVRLGFCF